MTQIVKDSETPEPWEHLIWYTHVICTAFNWEAADEIDVTRLVCSFYKRLLCSTVKTQSLTAAWCHKALLSPIFALTLAFFLPLRELSLISTSWNNELPVSVRNGRNIWWHISLSWLFLTCSEIQNGSGFHISTCICWIRPIIYFPQLSQTHGIFFYPNSVTSCFD